MNLGFGKGGATTGTLTTGSVGLERIEYSELKVTEDGDEEALDVSEVFIGSVFDLVDVEVSPEN